jgi:hypothetical protein
MNPFCAYPRVFFDPNNKNHFRDLRWSSAVYSLVQDYFENPIRKLPSGWSLPTWKRSFLYECDFQPVWKTIKRYSPFAAIGAGNFPGAEIVSDQAQHKAGEMVLGQEVATIGSRNSGSSIFQARNVAHAARWNATRSSLQKNLSPSHFAPQEAPEAVTDAVKTDENTSR